MIDTQTYSRILIIDDNPADFEATRLQLEESIDTEYLIQSANTILAGSNELRSADYDVVLLDLNLPDSKGLPTIQELVAEFPNQIFIVMNGIDDHELAVNAMKNGAKDVLTKKFTTSYLINKTIRYALERRDLDKLIMQTVVDTQEQERQKYAEQLHEGICQRLTGINLTLNALTKKLNGHYPEEKGGIISENENLNEVINELRMISYDLMPPSVKVFGLLDGLSSYLSKLKQMKNVQTDFFFVEGLERFDPQVEIGLFRIVQDYISFSRKMAPERRINLMLLPTDEGLALQLNTKAIHEKKERLWKRQEIRNLVNRTDTLDGKFHLDIDPSEGLLVTITTPCTPLQLRDQA